MNSPIQEMYARVLDSIGEIFRTLRSPLTWLKAIIRNISERMI